jgi:hypothetical protein
MTVVVQEADLSALYLDEQYKIGVLASGGGSYSVLKKFFYSEPYNATVTCDGSHVLVLGNTLSYNTVDGYAWALPINGDPPWVFFYRTQYGHPGEMDFSHGDIDAHPTDPSLALLTLRNYPSSPTGIYTVRLDTTELTQLVVGGFGYDGISGEWSMARWNYDGTMIAGCRRVSSLYNELYVGDAQATDFHMIRNGAAAPYYSHSRGNFCWARTQNLLAMADGGFSTGRFRVMDTDGNSTVVDAALVEGHCYVTRSCWADDDESFYATADKTGGFITRFYIDGVTPPDVSGIEGEVYGVFFDGIERRVYYVDPGGSFYSALADGSLGDVRLEIPFGSNPFYVIGGNPTELTHTEVPYSNATRNGVDLSHAYILRQDGGTEPESVTLTAAQKKIPFVGKTTTSSGGDWDQSTRWSLKNGEGIGSVGGIFYDRVSEVGLRSHQWSMSANHRTMVYLVGNGGGSVYYPYNFTNTSTTLYAFDTLSGGYESNVWSSFGSLELNLLTSSVDWHPTDATKLLVAQNDGVFVVQLGFPHVSDSLMYTHLTGETMRMTWNRVLEPVARVPIEDETLLHTLSDHPYWRGSPTDYQVPWAKWTNAAWNHDGTKIGLVRLIGAVSGSTDVVAHIYVMDADGGNLTRLVGDGGNFFFGPSYGFHGLHMGPPTIINPEIHTSQATTIIGHQFGAWYGSIAWAPNDNVIAYSTGGTSSPGDGYYVVDMEGNKTQVGYHSPVHRAAASYAGAGGTASYPDRYYNGAIGRTAWANDDFFYGQRWVENPTYQYPNGNIRWSNESVQAEVVKFYADGVTPPEPTGIFTTGYDAPLVADGRLYVSKLSNPMATAVSALWYDLVSYDASDLSGERIEFATSGTNNSEWWAMMPGFNRPSIAYAATWPDTGYLQYALDTAALKIRL